MTSNVSSPVLRARRTGLGARTDWWALAMIAPALIGLAALYIWPFVSTFIKSFMNVPVFGPGEFNGIENYQKLLTDEDFWHALGNTTLYTGIVLLGIPLAIVLASLIQQLTSVAFGGTDRRTVYLGTLHGSCLYRFRADVAGAIQPHWGYPQR